MSSEPRSPGDIPAPVHGHPPWAVALLYPPQGEWTEEDFLALDTSRLVELSEGCLEVLPLPTLLHQALVQFIFKALEAYVTGRRLGFVFVAPSPVRLWAGKLREPDIIFLKPGRIANPRRPPSGADLVVEVVSDDPESRHRDLDVKRREYARAGIEEYWIVQPVERRVQVLALAGDVYRLHGEFAVGARAASRLLPDFEVEVEALFATGDALPGA